MCSKIIRSAVWIVILTVANLTAMDKPKQNWVLSFDTQLQVGNIWVGNRLQSVKSLRREFSEKYSNKDYFVFDNHVYQKDDLAKVAPPPAVKPETNPPTVAPNTRYPYRTSPTANVKAPEPVKPKKPVYQSLTAELYLWAKYCQGLEYDYSRNMIKTDPLCSHCKGKGHLTCKLCKGQGHWFGTQKNFKLAITLHMREIKKIRSDTDRECAEVYDRPGSQYSKRSSVKSIEEKEKTMIQQVQSKIDELRKAIKNPEKYPNITAKVPDQKVRVKCHACQGRKYICCPKCVLTQQPQYIDLHNTMDGPTKSHKLTYRKRWESILKPEN